MRSLQTRGAFGSSRVVGNVVKDERTLLALELNGETLDIDHGYPARLIAPNRPGVFQTKWVNRIEVRGMRAVRAAARSPPASAADSGACG